MHISEHERKMLFIGNENKVAARVHKSWAPGSPARTTKFYTVAPNISGYSLWNFLYVTIWRLLNFWKSVHTCVSVNEVKVNTLNKLKVLNFRFQWVWKGNVWYTYRPTESQNDWHKVMYLKDESRTRSCRKYFYKCLKTNQMWRNLLQKQDSGVRHPQHTQTSPNSSTIAADNNKV